MSRPAPAPGHQDPRLSAPTQQDCRLIAHPRSAPDSVIEFVGRAARDDPGRLTLHYRLLGPLSHWSIPAASQPRRRDGLWRHTCCEAFLRAAGSEAYYEINLSPSTEWAIYRFDAYRHGMQPLLDEASPVIRVAHAEGEMTLSAQLELAGFAPELRNEVLELALAAVLETRAGTFSYWACHHPAATPDFHHPRSFVLGLAPPSSTGP